VDGHAGPRDRCSGMTLNVRRMPLPPISIGVCLGRIGDVGG
jgi:hypothetical protein